jgi:hypothetical protein
MLAPLKRRPFMSMRGLTVGIAAFVVAGAALTGCCGKRTSSDSSEKPTLSDNEPSPSDYKFQGTHFHFNRVPLEVDIPPGWKETQNTRNWAVFKPTGGGALAAFSPGTDCGQVEKRFYSALGELGLTNVVWNGGQKTILVNGLSTVTAEGTAIEGSQVSYIKYALTKSPRGGCLVSLVNIWKNRSGDYMSATEKMFGSVSLQ